jgi:predicted aspartyl protease
MKLGTWTIVLWLKLVGLATLTAWAQDPGLTSRPIKVKDGYLVVAKGSIGRLNDLTFLLDTGTSRTLIDLGIAKQLQLEGLDHKLTVFDQEVEAKLVVLPDLRLGAIHARSPHVIVTNLSSVAQNFGLHADAVLGMDILRLGSFSIDYKSGRIRFGDSEPMASVVPVGHGQPYLILKARIDDFPVSLMIDTGCDDVVLFANRLPKGFKKGYFTESRALTLAERAPLTQVGFGNLAVATSPAHKVKLKIISTGSNDIGYDGIVGVQALRASRIRFNFGEMTVSWK